MSENGDLYLEFHMDERSQVVPNNVNNSFIISHQKNHTADKIAEFISSNRYSRWKNWIQEYKGRSFTLRSLQVIKAADEQLWYIKETMDDDKVVCRGSPVTGQDDLLRWKKASENADAFALFEKNGDEAELMIHSDNFPEGLLSEQQTSDITRHQLKACLLECMECQRELTFFLELDCQQRKCRVSPFIQSGKQIVLLRIDLSEEDHLPKSSLSDTLLTEHMTAAGIIRRNCGKNEFFYDMNVMMKKQLNRKQLTLQDILRSMPYQNAIAQGSACFGKLTVLSISEEKQHYLMGAVPILCDGQADGVFVMMIPAENYEMIDGRYLRNMTARERTIMKLVMDGRDNQYISAALQISEGTVKRELYNCFKKLKVCSKLEAVKKLYNL